MRAYYEPSQRASPVTGIGVAMLHGVAAQMPVCTATPPSPLPSPANLTPLTHVKGFLVLLLLGE
jgi:hypothetical protein